MQLLHHGASHAVAILLLLRRAWAMHNHACMHAFATQLGLPSLPLVSHPFFRMHACAQGQNPGSPGSAGGQGAHGEAGRNPGRPASTAHTANTTVGKISHGALGGRNEVAERSPQTQEPKPDAGRECGGAALLKGLGKPILNHSFQGGGDKCARRSPLRRAQLHPATGNAAFN